MAIVCNTCKYILSETEVLSHVTNDIYDVVKVAAPAIVSACIVAYIQKRGCIEDFALATANRQKVVCSVCMKYKGWTKIADENVDEKEIE